MSSVAHWVELDHVVEELGILRSRLERATGYGDTAEIDRVRFVIRETEKQRIHIVDRLASSLLPSET